jgi:SAM-dependent methyltransferase
MLTISEQEIRRNGPGRILAVLWRQWRTERQLAKRGILFRATNVAQVHDAYAAMSQSEFDAINGPQDWANWRTIPRALSGRIPEQPLRVLDLGCGTGSSTQVLAFYCPPGSHVSGYELAEPLLPFARRRRYCHRHGKPTQVDFICQGVTETLRLADGMPLPPGSVDLINASGIVGHHLNSHTIRPLLTEIQRILKPTGLAMLDVGPTLPGHTLNALMRKAAFDYVGHCRSWFLDPTGEMVFRRK